MSKLSRATRTTRPRSARDFYRTIDPRAAAPLVAHLGPDVTYAEPCAGDGALVDLFAPHGWQCEWAADIKPARRTVHTTGQLIGQADVESLPAALASIGGPPRRFITNPPWNRETLHKMISTLAPIAETWLLFDANWISTGQAAPFAKWCSHIIAVGRLIWFEGTTRQSTDDHHWHRFDANHSGSTEFIWPTSAKGNAHG